MKRSNITILIAFACSALLGGPAPAVAAPSPAAADAAAVKPPPAHDAAPNAGPRQREGQPPRTAIRRAPDAQPPDAQPRPFIAPRGGEAGPADGGHRPGAHLKGPVGPRLRLMLLKQRLHHQRAGGEARRGMPGVGRQGFRAGFAGRAGVQRRAGGAARGAIRGAIIHRRQALAPEARAGQPRAGIPGQRFRAAQPRPWQQPRAEGALQRPGHERQQSPRFERARPGFDGGQGDPPPAGPRPAPRGPSPRGQGAK